MSWLNVNIDEVKKEQEKAVNGGDYELLEAGVYNLALQSCYIDMTSGGTEYINFEFKTEDGKDVFVTGWAVQRMVRKSTGEAQNSNGAYFNGIILLNMFAEQIGKDVTKLQPQQITKEIWGNATQVTSFNELLNKKYTVGIRHRKSFYEKDGEEKESIKLEIVGVLNQKDEEAINKMKERIVKKPLLEDKKKSNSSSKSTETTASDKDIPF